MITEIGLPFNITFTPVGDDSVTVYGYSPLQSTEPMVASQWNFTDNTLTYSHKESGVRLKLTYNNADSTFKGDMRQGIAKWNVLLRPSKGMFKLNRPQNPVHPLPYREVEISVQRRHAEVTLGGTLALPNGEGPFPAVVLISGSGQQNRDEEIMGHRPFAVLSDHLVRQGIAVLRYDDRGVGSSTGDIASATTLDFADDAEAIFSRLRKDRRIDSRRIGLIGHSEGAAIAAIVASRNSKVKFIVMMAGQGCNGADILLQQNESLLTLKGVDSAALSKRLDFMQQAFDTVKLLAPTAYETALLHIADRVMAGASQQERKDAMLRRGEVTAFANQFQMPWMRTFLTLNTADYLAKIRCPILAMNGSLDMQVLPKNLNDISRATQGKATTVLMPGLNHLFQHCTTGDVSEYMLIEETMAEEAMSKISQWILSLQ